MGLCGMEVVAAVADAALSMEVGEVRVANPGRWIGGDMWANVRR
jgi:hypothetical protein